ncbi:putative Hydroxymethylglutaryl-CoA synthase [Blattamonas nauphoetae]|uniref:Hydroxymethylglutaryl-CoA synthase n=1 Tax=Blattamonas nauphoetae TaxID=2049346 RepID=A0ABQ9XTC3_9EUKA|nr:putative Hydroxymethylglutaryl-CoA synthase [Blattamonas nauphoetae]
MSVYSNVGISAIEVYFPTRRVKQEDFEEADKRSKGNYTIGLGQIKMAFTGPEEDVISFSKTVVQRLLEKNAVDIQKVGRIEVGTETIVDHSKSIKTYLMEHFLGNPFIEGCDTYNACYGATSALFNAVDYTRLYGKYSIVVASDIAIYGGPSLDARHTGGAGAVAMLITPNAPLVVDLDRKVMSAHVYDFHKPNTSIEFPYVEGKLSTDCYLQALALTHQGIKQLHSSQGKTFSMSNYDYQIFHAPFNKMIMKAHAFLTQLDADQTKTDPTTDLSTIVIPDPKSMTELVKQTKQSFDEKVGPSTLVPRLIGNSYTATLFMSLASILHTEPEEKLNGKSVFCFSYGSGLIAAIWSVKINKGSDEFPLSKLIHNLSNIQTLLDSEIVTTVPEFEAVMKAREDQLNLTHQPFNKNSPQPKDALIYATENPGPVIGSGVFYLKEITHDLRRTYVRKE